MGIELLESLVPNPAVTGGQSLLVAQVAVARDQLVAGGAEHLLQPLDVLLEGAQLDQADVSPDSKPSAKMRPV